MEGKRENTFFSQGRGGKKVGKIRRQEGRGNQEDEIGCPLADKKGKRKRHFGKRKGGKHLWPESDNPKVGKNNLDKKDRKDDGLSVLKGKKGKEKKFF